MALQSLSHSRRKYGCNSGGRWADSEGLVGGKAWSVERKKMNFSIEMACFGEF